MRPMLNKRKRMMKRKNPFDGDSYYALFARVTYKRFISREWVTHADVMAEYLGLISSEELPCGVSKCEGNGELKKHFLIYVIKS